MDPISIYRDLGPSVCRLVYSSRGEPVGSGTGFLVNGKVVTCAHVLCEPAGCDLTVSFAGRKDQEVVSFTYPAFGERPRRLGNSDEHSYDFTIFEPLVKSESLPPSLNLKSECPEPGEPVCTLGYPFDDSHLTMSRGIVSAVYPSGVATLIKLDMNVNPSNSGGPLIRESDGAVLGLVARKHTGLTTAFDELVASADQNIAALRAIQKGGMQANFGGFNLLAHSEQTQLQLKIAAQQLHRSANVGIGIAILADALSAERGLGA